MRVIKEPQISQIDIDLIRDDIDGLAKDIINLDADVEWLSRWTKSFCEENFNPLLRDVDHNFEVLERRINKLKRWATGSFICIILLAIAIILKSVGL